MHSRESMSSTNLAKTSRHERADRKSNVRMMITAKQIEKLTIKVSGVKEIRRQMISLQNKKKQNINLRVNRNTCQAKILLPLATMLLMCS